MIFKINLNLGKMYRSQVYCSAPRGDLYKIRFYKPNKKHISQASKAFDQSFFWSMFLKKYPFNFRQKMISPYKKCVHIED